MIETPTPLETRTSKWGAERTRLLLVANRSPESRRAMLAAAELARAMDFEVVVLHVHERNAYLIGTGDFQSKDEASAFVSTTLARLEAMEVAARGQLYVTRNGRAAEAIVAVAGALGTSLIIMGRSRVSWLNALLDKSLVEKVIRQSAQPVLAVP